ncbi:killer cell lectin-like receptor subfamily B member 1B allele A [Podarcis raffonei]|uniref:killer cell lectin-like receptor subfamily B member 1B allele A n=1 Tax=Podarcis raffonei TaxID=65483 RepID=UPI00232954E7|nr:killer cell lectin-like receptor subfamily B member 1B allele A [Podarcis raffonei]
MAGEIAYADLNIREMPSCSRIPMPRPGRNSNDHKYTQGLRVALGTACAVILLLILAVLTLIVLVLQPKERAEDTTTSSSTTDSEFKLQLKRYMCISPSHSRTEDAPNCKVCPKDWELHRDICYWISQAITTWAESQEDCRGKNSTLLVIRDQQEMAIIKNLTKKTSYWLGLKAAKLSEEWTWEWVDGSPFKEELFTVSDPAKVNSCGLIRRNSVNSNACSTLSNWMCMKAAFQI